MWDLPVKRDLVMVPGPSLCWYSLANCAHLFQPHIQCQHIMSFNLAVVGVFIPQELIRALDQGLPSPETQQILFLGRCVWGRGGGQ